ncbi:MAG: NAD(P)H-dependent oxidoreductase [Eubacteriales bacterium]
MNILVLNGSPKGKNSVTIQTSLYLEKRFNKHTFEILNVAQKIRSFEKDMTSAMEAIEKADLIIYSYPVYTFLVPYQLHRFIELMKENNVKLTDKYVTQISTSKHFYDITAHKFIEENAYDMGARYIRGLSADMEDLLEVKGQTQAVTFFEKVLFAIEKEIYTSKDLTKSTGAREIYAPQLTGEETVKKSAEKDVLVVTNAAADDENLRNMIDDFKATCEYQVREVNIREYKFSGGCLGCMECTATGSCIYKDGFPDFLRNNIQNADAIIYAYTIENHYTHSSFKCYDDRQFCNGHRPVTKGMPVGYIISGDYESEHNVQTLVEGRTDVGGVYLCGIVTDERDTTTEIKQLSDSLSYALTHQIDLPNMFYGVGGTKIFRDLVYKMQGMMQEDHKFYKKNGIYDFPQNNKLKILQMKIIGMAITNPKIKAKMPGTISQFIIQPYTKLIDEAKPIEEK